jgi:hypothetical protein
LYGFWGLYSFFKEEKLCDWRTTSIFDNLGDNL